MENRKEDRRSSDRTLKNLDVIYERLDNRIYNVEILANEARAEFRAVRDELKKRLERIESEMKSKLEALDKAISSHKIMALTDEKAEKKEYRMQRWHFIGAVLGILVSGAVMPTILNWDRVEAMASSIKAHFHRAANTKVPLMLDVTKKPRRRKVKKKPLPPIILPEPKEQEHEESPEQKAE